MNTHSEDNKGYEHLSLFYESKTLMPGRSHRAEMEFAPSA